MTTNMTTNNVVSQSNLTKLWIGSLESNSEQRVHVKDVFNNLTNRIIYWILIRRLKALYKRTESRPYPHEQLVHTLSSVNVCCH